MITQDWIYFGGGIILGSIIVLIVMLELKSLKKSKVELNGLKATVKNAHEHLVESSKELVKLHDFLNEVEEGIK